MKIEAGEKTFKIDNLEKLEIFYFQVTDLWKKICEEHTRLFDFTCQEYVHLLESDVEALDKTVANKQIIIDRINDIDALRRDLIDNINSELGKSGSTDVVENVTDLLSLMQHFEETRSQRHLFGFNAFLIDVIEKIQTQNKKNQLFLNKALMSLKDIREEIMGKKNYKLYTHKGSTTSSTQSTFTTPNRRDYSALQRGDE